MTLWQLFKACFLKLKTFKDNLKLSTEYEEITILILLNRCSYCVADIAY